MKLKLLEWLEVELCKRKKLAGRLVRIRRDTGTAKTIKGVKESVREADQGSEEVQEIKDPRKRAAERKNTVGQSHQTLDCSFYFNN